MQYLSNSIYDPLKYTMDHSNFIVSILMEVSSVYKGLNNF